MVWKRALLHCVGEAGLPGAVLAQEAPSTTSGTHGQAALPATAAGPAPSTETAPPAQADDGSLQDIIVIRASLGYTDPTLDRARRSLANTRSKRP